MISMKKKPGQAPLAVVILAAGKGTRMQSDLPKVLHKVDGRSMLEHVITCARQLAPSNIVVIAGYKAELVQAKFAHDAQLQWGLQTQMRGTGHAVQFAREALLDFQGNVLVLYGDVPAISATTLNTLIQKHENTNAAVTMLTADLENPTGYGRMVKNTQGHIQKIVEEKDATDQEKNITEINTGIGVYQSSFLFDAVFDLQCDNQQNEYYLTDVVEMAVQKDMLVESLCTSCTQEVLGVNDLPMLARMEAWMQDQSKRQD